MPVEAASSDIATSLCCLGVVFFLAIGLIMLLSRRRHKAPAAPSARPADPYAGMSTTDLNQLASGKLVDADNAVRTSEQELGFAVAQYGQEAASSFTAALNASKQDVAEAFHLRQQLDDAIPEDELTRRGMMRRIVELCDSADKRLDAEADQFQRLRAMESQVDQLAAELTKRREAADKAVPLAQQTWQDLSTRYAGTALNAVQDNTDQARSRIEFAGEQLDQAAAAIAAGDRATAALRVRAGEQALGQAAMLLDALLKVKTDLEKAEADLASLLADVHGQVAAGKAALQVSGSTGRPDQMNLAAAVAKTEQIVTDARAAQGKPGADPIGSLHRVESAAAELNSALTGIRDAAVQTQQARSLLSQAVFTAQSTIDAVADFITTRRGAIGPQARTRLMEAQRQLQLATSSTSDPTTALAAAQRANDLAENAMQLARADVTGWQGGPVIISGGSGMGGAVLGGILIDSMFGGTMRRPSPWGFAATPEPAPDSPVDGPVPGRFGGPSTWTRPEATP